MTLGRSLGLKDLCAIAVMFSSFFTPPLFIRPSKSLMPVAPRPIAQPIAAVLVCG